MGWLLSGAWNPVGHRDRRRAGLFGQAAEKKTALFYSEDPSGKHLGLGLAVSRVLCQKHDRLLCLFFSVNAKKKVREKLSQGAISPKQIKDDLFSIAAFVPFDVFVLLRSPFIPGGIGRQNMVGCTDGNSHTFFSWWFFIHGWSMVVLG